MTTRLFVKNSSTESVIVYITLGMPPGCVHDVADITCTNGVTINRLQPLMGNFPLQPGEETELSAPVGMGFNGNFSFNTPPLNCPTPELPNGVVLAEFIINNGFQQYGQETIDISCVAGANAYLEYRLSANDWTSNWGKIPVTTIANGAKLDNTGRVGVFPYGCDNCTSSDNPPSCVGKHPELANHEPICNVQRSAASNQGGSITVVFKGTIN